MPLSFFITARMGSTRLPRKHFQDVAGRPALSHLIERVEAAAQPQDLIVITTGPQLENGEFQSFQSSRRVTVFFGDAENIPRRHLQAAHTLGASAIVAVDGDDLLLSINAMMIVAKQLREGAGLVKTTGLPLGMNAWGYSASVLSQAVESGPTADKLDTGWGRIFERFPAVTTNFEFAHAKSLRMTLDYAEDLEFFRRVFSDCPAQIRDSDPDLLEWIVSRGIEQINQHLNAVYWENFNRS